ncbi:hypothetical protein OSB04_028706 [Centaurea solstitialis]|uniref:Uncharacterized protein n=1 Tax=Centaurea solstitialis TaxID=347529 RepID=A0AA38STQ3_9ASTR|nr:hypothetical protein OSB04_028706 [Centaurea solstitialis]
MAQKLVETTTNQSYGIGSTNVIAINRKIILDGSSKRIILSQVFHAFSPPLIVSLDRLSRSSLSIVSLVVISIAAVFSVVLDLRCRLLRRYRSSPPHIAALFEEILKLVSAMDLIAWRGLGTSLRLRLPTPSAPATRFYPRYFAASSSWFSIYEAYSDYESMMNMAEEIVTRCAFADCSSWEA